MLYFLIIVIVSQLIFNIFLHMENNKRKKENQCLQDQIMNQFSTVYDEIAYLWVWNKLLAIKPLRRKWSRIEQRLKQNFSITKERIVLINKTDEDSLESGSDIINEILNIAKRTYNIDTITPQ